MSFELQDAVRRSEIVAYYQPQIDLETGEIVGVEALSRWRHPTLGLLTPESFIPDAEANGTINDIGGFMLDDGCRCAAAWRRDGYDVEVAINVSAVQLASDEFFDRVTANLAALSLGPQSITVEITESRAIADPADAAIRLAALRARGVDVSIDDFGTGHSSIEQMLGLPANEVKIDKSIVHRRTDDGDTVMRDLIEIAHEHGLRVVAEGIETVDHLLRARDMGCDRAQGFFLGRPAPETEITQMLAVAGHAI
ncbi:EAL domain-containing protein [Lacisediminihabitans changchengi]|uniref:EAL domain-containing protein n=1 Tax=Lacisediminihabitans changchengi TaxID=2787634 RepID=A0A934SUH0_9MICO|nr:EAL domain-containing protein [Lacisediminihabitans changchengi]MBK4348269.1 EAL domain-containing protein [Lacisediminihabitans changchengi]